MLLMLKAVELAGPELARIAFNEAMFQVVELPKRTEDFRKKTVWKP